MSRRYFVFSTQHRDSQPVWTCLAAATVVGAALLAVFGVPTVDLHGPLHYLGVMDPLCGGTRSVYLTLHGQLGEAVRYNPAGPLVLAAAAVLLARAAAGCLFGRWLSIRIAPRILLPVALVALVALEVNQQMHAVLLTQSWSAP
ncbi:hypothetical protein AFM11_30425 [Mycolicibacterium wolinskyi]|uniref:DUF2752 domain-containing protein n=1 Tax=Mycolicibacterium wolinskyi TaxID=59750 RepID=A0A132PDS8_9MYCO|nr:DUF2752 domain-containing protein [Mycolicibacterium wolinskyi]KWX20488.1 hypothetical protein AFM11_30425 [Mycolicibacterium wolinskyi]